jgi:peptide/nickel transport system permease protein
MGLDIFGRSVLEKAIQGIRVAIVVGTVASIVAVIVGVTLGALAGYFGGRMDTFVVWLYTTFESIPGILLLMGIAWLFQRGLTSVCIAIGLTSWVTLCRVIRGEFLKHKRREYVIAAEALGIGHRSRIFKHILPNVSHQIIVSFSMLFQSAIKSEVILSYLGLGVQGQPSWGTMIDDARQELQRQVWWQLSAATLFMFGIVLALNLLGDALRDALDPKLK